MQNGTLILMLFIWSLAATQMVDTWRRGSIFSGWLKSLYQFRIQVSDAMEQRHSPGTEAGWGLVWFYMGSRTFLKLFFAEMLTCSFCALHWCSAALILLWYVHNAIGTGVACVFAVVKLAHFVHCGAERLGLLQLPEKTWDK